MQLNICFLTGLFLEGGGIWQDGGDECGASAEPYLWKSVKRSRVFNKIIRSWRATKVTVWYHHIIPRRSSARFKYIFWIFDVQ